MSEAADAYLKAADWSANHTRVNNGATLDGNSFPTLTEFIAWVAKWSKRINSYLETNTNYTGTDALQHIQPVMDDLIWWVYLYELASKMQDMTAILQIGIPQLTPAMRAELDMIDVDELTEAKSVAWSGDMQSGDLY